MSILYVTLWSWHPCYTWEKSKFIAGWTSNFDLAYNENHENHWSSMKCLKSWMIFNFFHLHYPACPCHQHSQRAQRSETATDGALPRALSEAWPSAPTLPGSESCGSWRRPDFLLTVPLILNVYSGGALGACLHIYIIYIYMYINIICLRIWSGQTAGFHWYHWLSAFQLPLLKHRSPIVFHHRRRLWNCNGQSFGQQRNYSAAVGQRRGGGTVGVVVHFLVDRAHLATPKNHPWQVVQSINEKHENSIYLAGRNWLSTPSFVCTFTKQRCLRCGIQVRQQSCPGIPLSQKIIASSNVADAVNGAEQCLSWEKRLVWT